MTITRFQRRSLLDLREQLRTSGKVLDPDELETLAKELAYMLQGLGATPVTAVDGARAVLGLPPPEPYLDRVTVAWVRLTQGNAWVLVWGYQIGSKKFRKETLISGVEGATAQAMKEQASRVLGVTIPNSKPRDMSGINGALRGWEWELPSFRVKLGTEEEILERAENLFRG